MTAPPAPWAHDAFYRFVALPDADAVAARLARLAAGVGPLLGSLLVAPEGVNGTVAGPVAVLDAFREALRAEPGFAGLDFKRSHGTTRPFGRLRIHRKPALVALGFDPGPRDAAAAPVAPAAWRSLIREPDVVLIDNRNAFEWKLGRFRGALDPQAARFRDFPAFVDAHAAAWKSEGRRIAMYCTGGIRCEKTAGWLQRRLDLPVLQLAGGILHHFEALPDAHADFDGECFVFDNRIALDTRLQETATTAEQVYADPADAWRLQRARRLDAEG